MKTLESVLKNKMSRLTELPPDSSTPYINCKPWIVIKLWADFGQVSCIVVCLIYDYKYKHKFMYGVFHYTSVFKGGGSGGSTPPPP